MKQECTALHCLGNLSIFQLVLQSSFINFININLEHIYNIFITKLLYFLMFIMFVLSKNKSFQVVFNNVIAMPPTARILIEYQERNFYVKITFIVLKVQSSKICKSRKSPNNVFYCLSFILCVFSLYRNNEQQA